MQTRSAAKKAAQVLRGQVTDVPLLGSIEPSAPLGTTKSLEVHLPQKIESSTRGTRPRRQNGAVLPGEPKPEPQTEDILNQGMLASLKRSSDLSDSAPEKKPAKRSRVNRKAVAKSTLPADVLPHGLGKIHSTKTESTMEKNDGLSVSPLVLSTSDDTSGLIVCEQLIPFLTCFVQEIIEAAVCSLVEHAPETALAPPEGAPIKRQLRPRKGKGLPPPSRSTETATGNVHDADVVYEEEENEEENVKVAKKKRVPRKTKDNPYGLMPGRTPFPDWTGPTPGECREVHRVLTELHGEFKMPDKIPAPSTSVAGCGEVPDLVDAMIRTLVSGHTAMANANLAIQDVIAKYGQWSAESIGAGSIDWNKVRISEESEVIQAVKRAGLGPTKGKDIKLILEQVFEENQQRQTEYLREKATGETCDISGAIELTQGQKEHQLLKIQSGVLTLDHIRGMTPDEAMLEFTKYPGIGVKTASCLILFCLQQPSFAVDTHVWRFCKWLKWVPPKASRDDTYMHGEVRIPDELKYGLHQLFIRHGKECGRCRSGTVEGTSEWDDVVCSLEHLLDRFDKRKTKVQTKAKKPAKGKSKSKNIEEGGGSEDEYEE